MKIICDCGNECEFNEYETDGEINDYTEDEGRYVTVKGFTFWQMHDVVGIKCNKCDKDIWLFT
jgi:hypothetical protein